MKTALIIVDVQNDFLPGGALGITDGDAVVAPLIAATEGADLIVASRDYHPKDHVSFKAQGGPWPEHCVAGTEGAELVKFIEDTADVIVDKATEADKDAYSAFQGTGLAAYLKEAGITHVKVGGLATDYCVKATVLDALAAGFDTTVLVEASRPVGDEEALALALRKMRREGAKIRR